MQIPVALQKLNNRLLLVTPRLIMKKPLFLARVLIRILRQRLFKKKQLRSILFHSHYKCNLNCTHCYEKQFHKTNEKLLTLEEKKKVIADCLKLGVISFDFVSGESVLDPDLPELLKACRYSRTYITLATNGYGFTEEKIKNLLDIGVDKLNISLDSWYPEEHDEIRGRKGVHEQALKTLELCRKVGMGHHVTIFVYKNSTKTEGFKKLIEYAVENRIRVALKLAIPLGAWEGKHDNLITEDDRNTIIELHEKYPFVKTCHFGNRSGGCPAMDEVITITAYGDVLPCNGIHISLGNVRREKIQVILDRGKKIDYFKGGFHGCPPAEDMTFIESYLSKTYKADPYPVRAEEIFEELIVRKEKMGFNWENEVILITAGSFEGVTQALAWTGEQLGARVVVIARTRGIDKSPYKQSGNTFVFPYDFGNLGKVSGFYQSIVETIHTTPTILINDIRYQIAGFVQNTPVEAYEECYKVNVLFLVSLIQNLLPDMIKQEKGLIANIVSAVIYHSFPGLSAYYTAKTALGTIHESLRAELHGLPVKTLYIRPGGFLLNYWKNAEVGSCVNDFKYPGPEHIRDTDYLASRIYKAIEQGKEELNLGCLKDRIGYQLKYWMPRLLEKIIAVKNRELLEKRPDNQQCNTPGESKKNNK